MAETVLVRSGPVVSRRGLISGLISLGLAVLLLLMGLDTAGEISTFVLSSQRAGVTIPAPDLVLPADITLYVLALIATAIGFYQIFRGGEKVSLYTAIVASLVVLGFLIWATQGKSLNLTGMLVSSIVRATPIAFAALSGIYSERSGVVNIGIEGMMLIGAFTSVMFASITGNQLVGIVAGMAFGMLMGLLHAVLSIRYMVNQIISGTVIIILGLGITTYLHRLLFDVYPQLNSPGPSIPAVQILGFWRIPVIGPIVFNQSSLIYLLWFMISQASPISNIRAGRWGAPCRHAGHQCLQDALCERADQRCHRRPGGNLHEHGRCGTLQRRHDRRQGLFGAGCHDLRQLDSWRGLPGCVDLWLL
jgi:simple sugar transport system permease protein